MVSQAKKDGRPLFEAEQQSLGATHADVGGYLLDLWGLPAPLVEAVALHHEPSRTGHPVFSPLTAVHVANCLEESERKGDPSKSLQRLDSLYLDQLSLGSRLEAWRAAIVERQE